MATKKVCTKIPAVTLKNGTIVKQHVRCQTIEIPEPVKPSNDASAKEEPVS